MSDSLTHVLIGDWIGEGVCRIPDERINTPFVAALLAFASHAVLDTVDNDYTPDWTSWKHDADRLREDAPFLAAQLTGIGVTIASLFKEPDRDRFQRRLAGVLGSLAPDLIDGVYSYLHPEKWQKGELLMPWHRSADKGEQQSREQAMKRSTLLTLLQFKFRF